MDENETPPATPATVQTSARSASPAAAPAATEPEMLPTVRDHVERLGLVPWQVGAIVARLQGAHDVDGARVFADGVSLTTRMSNEDFDAAAKVALHGRV